MKNRFLLLLAVLVACSGQAFAGSDNPVLIGTWKADRVLTAKFNRAIPKGDRHSEDFVDGKTGHLTITVTAERVRFDGTRDDVQLDGMAAHRAPHDFDLQYSIGNGDSHTVEVSARDPISGTSMILDFNFDDRDTMWLRAGGPDMRVPDSRVRVYFHRVR